MEMNTVNLTLTKDELQIISDGLCLIPYGKAAPVINSINAQLQAQFNKENVPEQPIDSK